MPAKGMWDALPRAINGPDGPTVPMCDLSQCAATQRSVLDILAHPWQVVAVAFIQGHP